MPESLVTCAGHATLLKKKTLAQVFSYELCEISKNTFSYRTPPLAASVASVNGNMSRVYCTKVNFPHKD